MEKYMADLKWSTVCHFLFFIDIYLFFYSANRKGSKAEAKNVSDRCSFHIEPDPTRM